MHFSSRFHPSTPYSPLELPSWFCTLPLPLTMNVFCVPVCVDTDRTAPLKHPKYLAAVKRGDTHPPGSTYISEAVMRIVTGHVLKLLPRTNQSNIFEAQRFMRTVGKGCFVRPVFCIMICQLLFVPESQTNNESRRYYRKIAAEFSGSMWDLLY